MFPAAFESQNRWLLCLFKHTNELALPGAWAVYKLENLCIKKKSYIQKIHSYNQVINLESYALVGGLFVKFFMKNLTFVLHYYYYNLP